MNKFFDCISVIISANVLALGEEADFEAQNCLPTLNLIRSTKLHLSTEPAFLPNGWVFLLAGIKITGFYKYNRKNN